MIWWKQPDADLAVMATTLVPNRPHEQYYDGAMAEQNRRLALKNGDMLCDEILCPGKYGVLPSGDKEPEELTDARRDLQDLADQLENVRRDLEDAKDEVRQLEQKYGIKERRVTRG